MAQTDAADTRMRGLMALQNGNLLAAHRFLQLAADQEPDSVENWINLAVAKRAVKDRAGELAALDRALAIEPRELIALLLKGAHFADAGDLVRAGQVYGAALSITPPLDEVPEDLRHLVLQARDVHRAFLAEQDRVLTRHLDPAFAKVGAVPKRFRDSLDVFMGRRRVYHSEPHLLHVPGLAEIEFFDSKRFPWLPAVEARTEAMRDEFLAVMAKAQGFEPYITYPAGVPVDQWAELNHNPRWSAYHLIQRGELLAGQAESCPITMAAMAGADVARLPRRSPNAMFSVLQPHTRIPPHTGVTNARLVVHIPLIVPDHCGFRVGGETREWVPGQGFVFDDTIEHEAWNDSDEVRVVLIFDVWHPDLTQEERALLGVLFDGIDDFLGDSAPPEI